MPDMDAIVMRAAMEALPSRITTITIKLDEIAKKMDRILWLLEEEK